MSLKEIVTVLRLIYSISIQPGPNHLTATNGVDTRLQAKVSSTGNRIVTLKDQLGEEQTKSENLAGENQDLRIEATQRTRKTEAEFQKKAIRNIVNRAARALAEKNTESEDINVAHG